MQIRYLITQRYASMLISYDIFAAEMVADECLTVIESVELMGMTFAADFVQALAKGSFFKLAQKWVDLIDSELSHSERESDIRVGLLWAQALLAGRQGDLTGACAVTTRLINEMQGRAEGRQAVAAAHSFRGQNEQLLGRLDSADEDLSAGITEWASFGMPVQSASLRVNLADIMCCRGLYTDALATLIECDAVLPRGVDSDRADLCRARGDLAEAQGQWREADGFYAEAEDIYRKQRSSGNRAQMLLARARVAIAASQWVAASRFADQAADVSKNLAKSVTRELTKSERKAISDNSQGMRSLRETADRTASLEQAHELFRSSAGTIPNNFWAYLNLSYTQAEQQEWGGALEALSVVLGSCPDAMRSPGLYRTWRDYSLKQAQQLRHDGGFATAASLIERAAAELADRLPGQEVMELGVVRCAILAMAGALLDADASYAAFSGYLGAGEAIDPTAATRDSAGLTATLMSFIDSPAAYWPVNDMLRMLAGHPQMPAAVAGLLESGRQGLESYLSQAFGLAADAAGPFEPPLPIAIEVGPDLMPYIDPQKDGGSFIYTEVPEIRDRIKADTGFTIPFVRVRDNLNLNPNEFTVHVHGTKVSTGLAHPNAIFVVSPRIPDGVQRLSDDFQPLTGETGSWVPEKDMAGMQVDAVAQISPLVSSSTPSRSCSGGG